jgi:hypothetical protein
MGGDYAALTASPNGDGVRLSMRVCTKANSSGTESEAAARRMRVGPGGLRVEVREGAICRFSARGGRGAFEPIGNPFTAREGMWIGAKVGVFARAPHGPPTTGSARFEWFRMSGAGPEGTRAAP